MRGPVGRDHQAGPTESPHGGAQALSRGGAVVANLNTCRDLRAASNAHTIETMRRIAATMLIALGCQGDADTPAAAIAEPAGAAAPSGPTLEEQLAAAESPFEAVRLTKPLMGDTVNDQSEGTLLLASWAVTHMRWADVGTASGTTLGLVKKDPEAERGGKICVSGTVVQIQKAQLGTGPVFHGVIGTKAGEFLYFFAAGSTGDLVSGSRARFCGFVTGTYAYANTQGGETQSVVAVGMFKIRENGA